MFGSHLIIIPHLVKLVRSFITLLPEEVYSGGVEFVRKGPGSQLWQDEDFLQSHNIGSHSTTGLASFSMHDYYMMLQLFVFFTSVYTQVVLFIYKFSTRPSSTFIALPRAIAPAVVSSSSQSGFDAHANEHSSYDPCGFILQCLVVSVKVANFLVVRDCIQYMCFYQDTMEMALEGSIQDKW